MMSVKEYAIDVNKSSFYILDLCKRLGINANGEDYELSEDDIILLDIEGIELPTIGAINTMCSENQKATRIEKENLTLCNNGFTKNYFIHFPNIKCGLFTCFYFNFML